MEINCDVGELSREIDDAILPYVSACNICCGAHAGDESLIAGTAKEAIRLGVKVGAHPSWPDRENFGRKSLDIALEDLRISLIDQIQFVQEVVQREGGCLHHVKPHGALYHDVLCDEQLGGLFIDVVKAFDPSLHVYGMSGSVMSDRCEAKGLQFTHEVFGDRTYETVARLRSRGESDAVIDDLGDFRQQLQSFRDGKVRDIGGIFHDLKVESICIHSDTPKAVEFARFAHEFFQN